jgi:hypothetical protein
MTTRLSFIYVPPEYASFTARALRGMAGQRTGVTTDSGVRGSGTVLAAKALDDDTIEVMVELDDATEKAVRSHGYLDTTHGKRPPWTGLIG